MRATRFFLRVFVFLVLANIYATQIQALASTANSVSKSRTQIDFSGSSTHQILVSSSDRKKSISLPKWLASKKSHCHLLGSDKVTQTGQDTYKATLPSIKWFAGMEVTPTFFQTISIHGGRNNKDGTDNLIVKVSIEDSEVKAKNSSRIGGLVEKLMKSCSFQGQNIVKCTKVRGVNGEKQWLLTSEFTLNLQISLGSRLMILPPGFNAIGSKIVKSTVEKRVKENLITLADAFNNEDEERMESSNIVMTRESSVVKL